jgi:hypothetical protein
MHLKYVLTPFGIFYRNLVTYWQFGKFFPVLIYCVKKNLALSFLIVEKFDCETFFSPSFVFRVLCCKFCVAVLKAFRTLGTARDKVVFECVTAFFSFESNFLVRCPFV